MRIGLLAVFWLALTTNGLAGPLEDGTRAYDAGNYVNAIEIFKPLAAQGDAKAQFRLGMLFYNGQGVPEDEKLAVTWLLKAAKQGNVDAMFELGNAYLVGNQAPKLVEEPDREAAIWFHQAARAGHMNAQYYLGLLFLAGNGVQQSRANAELWFGKAAAQGHSEAKRAIQDVKLKK
jgi:TPR repeat protein